jgi:RNA polymerase sigma factor for flagellar operon FliA
MCSVIDLAEHWQFLAGPLTIFVITLFSLDVNLIFPGCAKPHVCSWLGDKHPFQARLNGCCLNGWYCHCDIEQQLEAERTSGSGHQLPIPGGSHDMHVNAAAQDRRIVAGLPFVEALARRMAASMPNSIDIGDLVQDGMIGLIDAANRFDEARGIKFETFAERRVRGAMIDALRKDAWPRGVRRQRRELDAAREALRRELGHEPSMADLAARVGSDEKRLSRTIVRINTIEATSPLATAEHVDESNLPSVLVPSEPDSPDAAYEKTEIRERIRAAIEALPPREQRVITLYYYAEATMKEIGASIGVNESRVSQLHARAVRRLRESLGNLKPEHVAVMREALVDLAATRPRMAKVAAKKSAPNSASTQAGRVLSYRPGLRSKDASASAAVVRRPARAAVAAAR